MNYAEQKHDSFTRQADHLIERLKDLFAEFPDSGNTEETSQKMVLENKLNALQYAVNGICVDDFNPWICTDLDNEQYGRQLDERIYEFKEKERNYTGGDDGNPVLLETDEFIQMEIDLDDYTDEQIENHISAYYNSVEKIKEEYGASWEWIVAECIFEQISGLY